MADRIIQGLRSPEAKDKLVHISIQVVIIIAAIMLLLIALSLTYADTYDPFSFFCGSNGNFSYSGTPESVTLFVAIPHDIICTPSGDPYLILQGKSVVRLYPNGNVTVYDNINYSTKDPYCRNLTGPINLTTSEDDRIVISTYLRGKAIPMYDNAYFNFSKGRITLTRYKDSYMFTLNCYNGTMQYYRLLSSDPPGKVGLPDRMDHVLVVQNGSVMINNEPVGFNGTIMFNGELGVWPAGQSTLRMPVDNLIMPLRIGASWIEWADGCLVLCGRTFPLRGADSIKINLNMFEVNEIPSRYGTQSRIFAQINNGKLCMFGIADSLIFREDEMITKPVILYINHDLSLPFATSSLTSIIALMLNRAVGRFRKRS